MLLDCSSVKHDSALQLTGWRRGDAPEELLRREWIVTNGLGGYASGSLAGAATRRYHGLLVAALPAPHGRYMMLNHLEEQILAGGTTRHLTGDEPAAGAPRLPEVELLREFRLEDGLPVWEFDDGSVRLTRRIVMPHLQNATWIHYRLHESSPAVQLLLTPSLHFRPHEGDVSPLRDDAYRAAFENGTLRIRDRDDVAPLVLTAHGAPVLYEEDARLLPELLYRIEQRRGYMHRGTLWSPGRLRVDLAPGTSFAIRCQVENGAHEDDGDPFENEYDRRRALLRRAKVEAGTEPLIANLVLAADQFIIEPATRRAETARDHAAGEEPRTVIAGYHWFTDWGRDTMISLEGLTLATGRTNEAKSILRTFARHVRDGLIPNMFPEGENEGVYHTADATMWFFHAVDRYVAMTGDVAIVDELLPILDDIITHHIRGTRFGIGVDPEDGLLRQGAEGYQLTWMDAKVDGWVVTPRRGKAVEINALFYNAVMLLSGWEREAGNSVRAGELASLAARTRASFNERFWNAASECLFDIVDGEDGREDSALRPNQILSISLRHPVLDETRWRRVVDVVATELLTPVGLRSLSREHPDYKRTYEGDLRTRDAAYHQGTVWSWLIGPFIDAYLKAYPANRAAARAMLEGLERHLEDAGIGSVSEIFDAEEPYEPRGCIAQAWGVAELLRCERMLR